MDAFFLTHKDPSEGRGGENSGERTGSVDAPSGITRPVAFVPDPRHPEKPKQNISSMKRQWGVAMGFFILIYNLHF
jgi:hypothetical protein